MCIGVCMSVCVCVCVCVGVCVTTQLLTLTAQNKQACRSQIGSKKKKFGLISEVRLG